MEVSLGGMWLVGRIDGCVRRLVGVGWMNGWMCRYVRGGWVDA